MQRSMKQVQQVRMLCEGAACGTPLTLCLSLQLTEKNLKLEDQLQKLSALQVWLDSIFFRFTDSYLFPAQQLPLCSRRTRSADLLCCTCLLFYAAGDRAKSCKGGLFVVFSCKAHLHLFAGQPVDIVLPGWNCVWCTYRACHGKRETLWI